MHYGHLAMAHTHPISQVVPEHGLTYIPHPDPQVPSIYPGLRNGAGEPGEQVCFYLQAN